ncbi:MAG: hypothetical protein KGO93_02750 [Cyanobacteria bacterium REEB446]|nr:hypothetical protein [Cyanobacteria bacterium REEB446]
MDAVNGSSLDKLGFDTKKAGDVQSPLASDTINGSRDRAGLLKQDLGGANSYGDATIFYSLLSDKQDKELEKAAIYGEDESSSVSVVDQAEEPVSEADGDDEDENKNKNKNKNVGAKPQDPLGLGKLGYTKEQVDGWIAQGYSVSDIKNGVAASGEKNTEVPNQIAEPA